MTSTTTPPVRVLCVDDDSKMVEIMGKHLVRLGYDVRAAGGGREALQFLDGPRRWQPDVVLTDVRMPGMDGHALLHEIARRAPETQVVLMTAFGAVPEAVAAMHDGAFWYLTKPFQVSEAVKVLERATAARREYAADSSKATRRYLPERYLGRSTQARLVREDLVRAAPLNTPVLLLGPTGTGKELAARIIHEASGRRSGPFVALNCAAIPEGLFESELFGHRRGAFTGAGSDCPGLCEEADGGTLFLDEVGELPQSQQPKLLRLLEESEVRRVGDRRPRRIDVRVIAATNQALQTHVEAGRFRADLYYRLAALVIELPDLASRPEDLPVIAQMLLTECARVARIRIEGFSEAALERLCDYDWPGNVRELRNAIEQALFRVAGSFVEEEHLPGWVRSGGERPAQPRDHNVTLDEVERRYIARVLEDTGWNRSRAATILGIDRRTLFSRIQKYGLAPQ